GLDGSGPVEERPGLDLLVVGIDAAEAGFDEAGGREPALADRGRGVDDRQLVGRGHCASPAWRKNAGSASSGSSAVTTFATSAASASMSRPSAAARSAPNLRVASAVRSIRIASRSCILSPPG